MLVLVGCESDADKLSRLQREASLACLIAAGAEREAMEHYDPSNQARSDSILLAAAAERDQCTLAERELGIFLSGR